MKIVVTSPSFSKSAPLREELGRHFENVTFNPEGRKFNAEELISFLSEADGAIIGLELMDEAVLKKLPRLRIISKYGVGLDNLDVAAATALGKTIGWNGGVNKRSVAEMTVAFMIGLTRNLFRASFALKQGVWQKDGGVQLTGKTVGLIGCGHVGEEVLHCLTPFQGPRLIYDILDKSEVARQYQARQVSLEALLREADIVSLHIPLTEQTRHLINVQTLSLMKTEAFLINTSRGFVVEQAALKSALQKSQIAGAALDVYEEEPPTDLEFLALPNLMITPHIGGNAKEAVWAMGTSAISHLKNFNWTNL